MSTVTFRINDQDKKDLGELCSLLGISMNTFFSICTKKAIQNWGIPFDMNAERDPFYSKSNMQALRHSFQQEQEGKMITKTLEELEELADA